MIPNSIHQNQFKPSFSPKQKIYGHILGGPRIASSGLEGALVENNLQHLIQILTEYATVPSQLIDDLKKCREWVVMLKRQSLSRICMNMVAQIKNLNPNESILLPGGWKGDPYGHSMLYEISKTDEVFFRLRVVDTGTGGEFFSSMHDDKKTYRLPCITYDQIPIDKLLYGENEIALLLPLMQLQTKEQSAKFTSCSIYQGWLKPLEEYRNDQELIDLKDRWITPQRAGTCSWNVLKAYLRIYLPKEMYKEVLLFVETKTLEQLFDDCQRLGGSSSEEVDQNNLELLKIGCQSVSHYLQAIKRQSIPISEDQIIACEGLLLSVFGFIERAPEKQQKQRVFHTVSPEVMSCEVSVCRPYMDRSESQSFNNNRNLSFYKTFPAIIPLNQIVQFVKILSEQYFCQSYHTNLKNRYGTQVDIEDSKNGWMQAVEEFAYRISFESDIYNPSEVVDSLKSIFDCYLAQGQPAAFSPRQLNTAFTLYFLMWKGLCRPESLIEASFSEFGSINELVSRLIPPQNLFELIDNNPFFLVFDEKDLHRMHVLRNQLSSCKTAGSLDPLKELSEEKSFPPFSINDDELTFLEAIGRALKSEIKDKWVLRYQKTIAKDFEHVGILGSYKKEQWDIFFPSFYDLILAHNKLCDRLKSVPDYQNLPDSRRNYRGKKDNSISLGLSNQYSNNVYFGYPIRYSLLPNQQTFFQFAFSSNLSLLKDRSYETTCAEVHQVEMNALSFNPDSSCRYLERHPLLKKEEWVIFLRKCAYLSTAHSLHFVHLLNLFTHYAHFLKEREARVLFLTQFFKIISDQEPLLKREIESNPAIVQQLIDFSEYVKQLATQQYGQEVDIELYAFSFFILQHSYRSLLSFQHLPLFERLEHVLNESLQFLSNRIREVFPQREVTHHKNALFTMHLHCLYFYLVEQEKRPLNKHEIAKVLSAYFAVKTFQTEPELQEHFLISEVVTFIQGLLPLEGWNSHELELLMKDIIGSIGFSKGGNNGAPTNITCQVNGILSCVWRNGDKIDLCLSSAGVMFNGRRLKCAATFSVKEYQELFGQVLYPVYSTGQTLYLEHPNGVFKVNKSKRDYVIEFSPLGEHLTYYFQGNEKLKEGSCTLPLYFIENHQHFYDPGKKEWVFIKNRDYSSFNTALRWKPKSAYITLSHSLGTPVQYSCLERTELHRIEHPRWIQQKEYAGEKWIELPRYNLTFKVDSLSSKLLWESDPSFAIQELQGMEEPSLIEGVKQFLLLSDSLGRELLFLPSFPLVAKEGISSKGEMVFSENRTSSQYHSYTVNKLETGEVILEATTQEGVLALAYHRVHERKYEEALQLLREISPIDELSDDGYRILGWLENYGTVEKNESPQALALKLHARVLKKEKLCHKIEKNHLREEATVLEKKKKKRQKPDNEVFKLLSDYYFVEAQVPFKLRLSRDQEFFLFRQFNLEEELSLRLSTLLHPEIERAFEEHRGDQNIKGKDDLSIINLPQQAFLFEGAYLPYFSSMTSLPDPLVHSNIEFFLYYQLILSEKWCHQELEAHLWTKLTIKKKDEQLLFLLTLLSLKEQRGEQLPLLPTKADDNKFKKSEVEKFNQRISELLQSWNRANHSKIVGSGKRSSSIDSFPLSMNKKGTSDYLKISQEEIPCITQQTISIEREKSFNEILGIRFSDIESVEMLLPISLPITENLEDFERECVEQEFLAINADIEAGRLLLQQEKRSQQFVKDFFPDNEEGGHRLAEIKHKLDVNLLEMKKKITLYCSQLLAMSNIDLPQGQLEHFHLDRLSGRSSKISLQMIEDAFFSSDFRELCTHNPAFMQIEKQEELLGLLLNYEIAAVQMLMGQKALEALQAAQKEGISPDEREYELLQLIGILKGSIGELTSYLKDANPILDLTSLEVLIFARRSSLIPRVDQLNDLNALCHQNCVLQKIMGGGKNAIIAALWLFVMSKRGNLPALFTDRSLYTLVGDNLKKSQKTSIGQEIFTIHISHGQINEQKLKQIEDDLALGLRQKRALLMCPETLQMLDLEKQNLIERNEPDLQETIDSLCRILAFFQEHVVGLGDEIDLLLRCDFEVNIPSGAKVRLLPKRIDLMKTIFYHLVTNAYLKEKVGLQQNRQCLLSKDDYEEVKICVANCLISYTPLKLKLVSEDIKEEFVKFIVMKPGSKIPPNFKAYVSQLRDSNDHTSVEAAHLISLARHTLQGLLPTIFTQTSGVNYGRYPGDNHGKVVPYLGVDTPANRELAYHYEAVCKHMITAVQTGVTLQHLFSIYDHFNGNAQREIGLKKCLLEATDAYKDFEDLVGITMEEFFHEEAREEVLNKINQNLEKVLNIEAESISLCVSYYEKYYHSSAQSFPHLLKSLNGMTGTPWNYDGYSPDLGHLTKDRGAEGKIIYTVLSRGTSVYPLKNSDVRSVIDAACSDGKPFPDAILDFAFLHKDQSPVNTAYQFLSLAQEKRLDHKKAVLFFHRKPEETSSDRLAIGTFFNGDFQVQLLRHTSLKAILKELDQRGLSVDNCLAFYDQRHTTGADLPLPPTARAVISAHSRQELRGVCQALMRARQFCSKQTIDVVLLEAESAFIFKEDPISIDRLISLSGVNQARKKATSLFRSFKQQIEEVFASSYRFKTRDGGVAESIQMCYDDVTKPTIKDNLFEAFFNEIIYSDPYTVIKAYSDHMLAIFSEKIRKVPREFAEEMQRERENIEQNIGVILVKVKEKHSLLSQLVEDPSYTIGHDIENQVDLRVEVQAEEEISSELVNELQRYQGGEYCTKVNHEPWWNEDIHSSLDTFIQSIKGQVTHRAQMCSLPECFNLADYQLGRNFGEMFPDHIIATRMFRVSLLVRNYGGREVTQTIFHKTQKPTEQILIIKIDLEKYLFILLASAEASFLKHALFLYPQENTWLVSSNGRPLVAAPSPLDLSLPEVAKSLCFINIFGGKASAIEDIPGGLLCFQMWLQGKRGSQKDRNDFVSLCSIGRSGVDQLKRLTKSVVSDTVIGLRHALTAEQIPEVSDPEKIFLFGKDEISYIIPTQVPHIRTELLDLLNEEALIQAVPLEKLCYLNSSFYQCLSKRQILHFSDETLLEKMSLLPAIAFSILTKEDLLDDINTVFFRNLNESQMKLLKIKLDPNEVSSIVRRNLHSFLRYCLSHEDVPSVANEHVRYLDVDACSYLTVEQLSHLSTAQVGHLKSGDVIQQLPENLLKHISLDSIKHLSEEQLRLKAEELTASQLSRLTDQQIALIVLPSVVQRLPKEQLQFLNPAQIPTLSGQQIVNDADALTDEQILALSDYQVGLVNKAIVVQKMSVNQLRYVSLGAIDLLSNHQFKHLAGHLTDDQLNGLSLAKLGILEDAAVINRLSPERLKEFSNPEQIQRINNQHLSHLLNAQLVHLSAAQVEVLEEEEVIQRLSKERLEFLPPAQIPKLSDQQIINDADALTDAQILALSDNQVSLVNKSEVVQKLSVDQLPHVRVDAIGLLSDHQLKYEANFLTDDQLNELPLDKLGLLEDAAVINRLSPGRLKDLVNPEQIQKIDNQNLSHLLSTQLVHLSTDQVGNLNEEEMIQQLPQEQLRFLNPAEIPTLSDQQIVNDADALADEQILALSHYQVGLVNKANVIQKLSVDQLRYVSLGAFDLLSNHQFKHLAGHLTDDQLNGLSLAKLGILEDAAVINRLSPERLKEFSNPEQIQRINNQHLSHLLNAQLVHLSAAQVEVLEEEGVIQRLSKERLEFLPPAQIPKLSDQQIINDADALADEQILALSDYQVGLVNKSEVVQKLSVDQLPHVSVDAIGLLSDHQLKHEADFLTDDQLNGLPLDKLGLLENAAVINRLSPARLKELLDPEQIQKINNQHLSHLSHAQIVHLSADQVGKVDEKLIIQRLPKKHLKFLNQGSIPQLSDKQIIDHVDELIDAQILVLSEKQVGLIEKPEVIQKLPAEQLPFVNINAISSLSDHQLEHDANHLTDAQLNELPLAKLGFVKDPKAINRLSQARLKELLTPEQIQKVDGMHVNYLADKQLKDLTKNQISQLQVEKISLLADHQLKDLSNAQVPSVSCLKVRHLKGEQVSHATLWQTFFMNIYQFSDMRWSQKVVLTMRFVAVLSTAYFATYWINQGVRRFFRISPF